MYKKDLSQCIEISGQEDNFVYSANTVHIFLTLFHECSLVPLIALINKTYFNILKIDENVLLLTHCAYASYTRVVELLGYCQFKGQMSIIFCSFIVCSIVYRVCHEQPDKSTPYNFVYGSVQYYINAYRYTCLETPPSRPMKWVRDWMH